MSTFEQVSLSTERLHLRWLVPPDAAALFTLFSNEATMRYLSMPVWTDIAKADESIARDIREHQTGDSLRFGIFLKDSDELIGTCQIFKVHAASRRAECGYLLAPAYWRQGLASEAMRCFLHYCFHTLKLNRLEADIDPDNKASLKLLQRLGFEREGVLPERWIVNGKHSDSWIYGLLAAQWKHNTSRSI